MIVLNLKTYPLSLEKTSLFARICSEVASKTDVRIVLAPPLTCIKDALLEYDDVFAQHADANDSGAFTGSVPAESLAQLGATGSLLNHSEKKLPHTQVKEAILKLHFFDLESIVCADSIAEAQKLALFNPSFIAVEPPELIGSGVSVSNAKPEVVTGTVAAIKKINPNITVLCGAGVSNAEDVKNALRLGAEGVLLASAFVKAKDPKTFLESLVSAFDSQ